MTSERPKVGDWGDWNPQTLSKIYPVHLSLDSALRLPQNDPLLPEESREVNQFQHRTDDGRQVEAVSGAAPASQGALAVPLRRPSDVLAASRRRKQKLLTAKKAPGQEEGPSVNDDEGNSEAGPGPASVASREQRRGLMVSSPPMNRAFTGEELIDPGDRPLRMREKGEGILRNVSIEIENRAKSSLDSAHDLSRQQKQEHKTTWMNMAGRLKGRKKSVDGKKPQMEPSRGQYGDVETLKAELLRRCELLDKTKINLIRYERDLEEERKRNKKRQDFEERWAKRDGPGRCAAITELQRHVKKQEDDVRGRQLKVASRRDAMGVLEGNSRHAGLKKRGFSLFHWF